ncbi:MAG: hypothetical protein ACRC0L_05975 [Angustibacter sp.]
MKLARVGRWLADPTTQIRLAQASTVVSTLRILKTNDPKTYARYQTFAKPALGAGSKWTPHRLRLLRPLVGVSGLWWLINPASRPASVAFVASSAAFQAETIRFHKPLWSYTNHIQTLSAIEALTLTGSAKSSPSSSGGAEDALRVMEVYLSSIYAQAAAAKLIHGGTSWVTRASTLRASLSELGRPPFRRLIPRRRLAQIVAGSSLLAEAAALPLAVIGGPRTRAALGAGIAGFHGGIKATLDISFWHLWWHLTPLLATRHTRSLRALTGSRAGRLALATMLGNIVATIFNRNIGPFCSYNMFYGSVPSEYPQLRVRVRYVDGTESAVLDVRGLMPFEFFRTVSMLERVFLHAAGEPYRTSCAQAILDGLNSHPWGPRDEVNPSLRSPDDPLITGFDLLLMRTRSDSDWRTQLDDDSRLAVVYAHG